MKGADGRPALRCWPIEVELGGRVFVIRGRPAIDWVLKIADESWLDVVPGLVDGDEIDQMFDAGLLDSRTLVAASRDAVSTATGMPWWSACRLVKLAVSDVEMAGSLVLAGVDPERVSVGAYVAAVYRLVMTDQDKKHRASINADLARVPKGVQTSELYDPQVAGAAFERAYGRQRKRR
jgi:hypothetical protein